MNIENHPYADLFPMMTAAELDALAADIEANGLRQPIVRYQGRILDGRNRLAACERIGAEPRFTDFEGDDAAALALVESLNVGRRDLTGAQRAIVAARRWLLNGDTKDKGGRPKKGEKPVQSEPVSLDALAKKYKTARASISQARDLITEAPDLAAQVEGCTLSLAAAYEQLQGRRKEAAQKAKDAERVAEYTDAISNGEMQLEEALQKAIEQERDERETVAAQADARRHWLEELARLLDWVERFIAQRDDEHLAWYTEPGSPGLFDHGITADRVGAAVAHLTRAQTFTFGENRNGSPTRPASRRQAQASAPGRPRPA